MLVYLDNCTFNRPFDNQTHIRIRLETEAKLHIQNLIKQKELDLVWSYVLTFENAKNPFFDKQFAIEQWQYLASVIVEEKEQIIQQAEEFVELGVKPFDALHLSCAIFANTDAFISTDDRLIKKANKYQWINTLNPIDFIKELP